MDPSWAHAQVIPTMQADHVHHKPIRPKMAMVQVGIVELGREEILLPEPLEGMSTKLEQCITKLILWTVKEIILKGCPLLEFRKL